MKKLLGVMDLNLSKEFSQGSSEHLGKQRADVGARLLHFGSETGDLRRLSTLEAAVEVAFDGSKIETSLFVRNSRSRRL